MDDQDRFFTGGILPPSDRLVCLCDAHLISRAQAESMSTRAGPAQIFEAVYPLPGRKADGRR